ncbi:MAG: UvrD-helicase domain-containing protein [bacterium]
MSRPGGDRPADVDRRDRLATVLDTSFAVGAGAGSGKTRVLVDRVVSLVDRGTDLERVVAITFTEKAASELRERVRSRLSGGDACEGEEERLRTEALPKVDLAQITTIHGFCRSLLASRPLEAGVPPGFRVLDALGSDLLLADVSREAVEELRQVEDRDLTAALLAGGRLSALPGLVRALRKYPDLEVRVPAPRGPALQEAAAELLGAARGIARFRGEVPEEDRLLQQALDVMEKERSLLPPWEDDAELAAILRSVAIHRNVGSASKWAASPEASGAFRDLKERWKELADLRDRALEGFADRALAWLTDRARRIAVSFQERKRQMGVLDFDDLLLLTARLLEEDRDTAEEMKGRFDVLLVDEFQDTDPVQARIVLRLSEPMGERALRPEEAVPGEGRLFVVGDENQSIYRFRRADLEVFRTARERVLVRGREERLEVNFRSLPRLVETANRVFGELLSAPVLTPYREPRGEDAPVTLLDLDPLLEAMPGVEGEEARTGQVRRAEARALAGWIQEHLGELPVSDPRSGELRTLQYRDVAVLVRTYTGISTYEAELERCGIPYRVSGGKAFFARLEVQQTLSVLRAVADPGDRGALAAALRSPAFGVSDQDLAAWALEYGALSYGDGLDDTGAAEALRHARGVLEGLHRQAGTIRPAAVLRRIYEETRVLPLHALKPDGDRRMANLLKLLDLARAYEDAAGSLAAAGAGTGPTLEGLVRHLEEQRRAAAEEESALVEEEGDAVRLLTIHSAKGLEYPVVALLDREYAARFQDEAIPVREEEAVTVRSAGLEPSDWKVRKEVEQDRQEEESLRLLYVAFTRARDHFLLPTRTSEDVGEKSSFLAPLEGGLVSLAGEGTRLVRVLSPGPPEEGVRRVHRLPHDMPVPSEAEREAAGRERADALSAWGRQAGRARQDALVRASSLAAEEPEGASGRYRQEARVLGTRVHEALEAAVARDGGVAGEEGAGGEGEMRDLVRKGLEMLAGARAEGLQPAAVEWPLLANLDGSGLRDVPEGARTLTGTADLILEGADGVLVIVDYKTDREDPGSIGRRYAPQLAAYRMALERASGRPVRCEIWALHAGRRVPVD